MLTTRTSRAKNRFILIIPICLIGAAAGPLADHKRITFVIGTSGP
jgi:hypothetical protein